MQHKNVINVTNDNLIIQQYNDFKFLMDEKLISGIITSLSQIADITINDKQFDLLSMLVDICTFQASNAECKRDFSLMNNIKVKSRNRLENTHLDHLMRIKLYVNAGSTVDLLKACTKWQEQKARREKM